MMTVTFLFIFVYKFVYTKLVILPATSMFKEVLGWWKESLNSDVQQFRQYKQNKYPPLTLNHWTWKRPWHMTLNIQVLSWDRYDNVAGLNIWMGPPLFDNWISNSNTDTIEMIKMNMEVAGNMTTKLKCNSK
jgi:hypothetical protein